MSKLKPCPFCNSKDAHTSKEYTYDAYIIEQKDGTPKAVLRKINVGYLVECNKCGARSPHEYANPIQSREVAIENWNRRVDTQATTSNI